MSDPTPTRLSIPLADAASAFLGQARRFVSSVDALDDRALLGASRCHGWTTLDVVVHVRVGLDEMQRGFLAPTDADPTVDAASYWAAWPASSDGTDDLDALLWTRRVSSAHRRPRAAAAHLHDVVDAILPAAQRMSEGRVRFQGQTLTAGDFLTIWAVELVVHHLDLEPTIGSAAPDPAALELARRTVIALTGTPPPPGLDTTQLVLIGAGRIPTPAGHDIRAVLG